MRALHHPLLSSRFLTAKCLLSALALLAASTDAGDAAPPKPEIILQENFDGLDLGKPRAGVKLSGQSGDSSANIEDKQGQNKALHLNVKKDKAAIDLAFPLDVGKLSGKELRCGYKGLFPGAFTGDPKAGWQRPRVMLTATQDDGKVWNWDPPYPEPNKKDWQTLNGRVKAPDKLKDCTLKVQIPGRVAECWFDEIVVEINPAPDPNKPPTEDEIVAKTPTKVIEEAGMALSPAIAKNVRQNLKRAAKGADRHEVVFIGPGMANAAKALPKAPDGWVFKIAPAGLNSADDTGLQMMQKLPDFLAKSRPGYVILVGAAMKDKGTSTEAQDWQDACGQCLRYGAIPILGVPDIKDDNAPGRWVIKTAASGASLPAVDFLNGAGPERTAILVKFLDQFVVGQGPTAAAAAGGKAAGAGGVPQDE